MWSLYFKFYVTHFSKSGSKILVKRFNLFGALAFLLWCLDHSRPVINWILLY